MIHLWILNILLGQNKKPKHFLILSFWLIKSFSDSKNVFPALAQWRPQIPGLFFLSVSALGPPKPLGLGSLTVRQGNPGWWVTGTDAVHSVAKACLSAFCGKVGGRAVPCVLLLWVIGEGPICGFSDPLVRPTEQLRTAGNSERKNEPLSVSVDSEVCLDMLWEGGDKQKPGGVGAQKDLKL